MTLKGIKVTMQGRTFPMHEPDDCDQPSRHSIPTLFLFHPAPTAEHRLYLLIQLAQLVGQIPLLGVAAIDLAGQLTLLAVQAEQLLPLLELFRLQGLQLPAHACQPASLNLP